jgi:hypothetical protein
MANICFGKAQNSNKATPPPITQAMQAPSPSSPFYSFAS